VIFKKNKLNFFSAVLIHSKVEQEGTKISQNAHSVPIIIIPYQNGTFVTVD
jgi:hypothetical protein